MLLSAVSFLVVAQSISEIPEGLMNNLVYLHSFYNNAINVIFDQLLAPAALLLVKNALNKSLYECGRCSYLCYFFLIGQYVLAYVLLPVTLLSVLYKI